MEGHRCMGQGQRPSINGKEGNLLHKISWSIDESLLSFYHCCRGLNLPATFCFCSVTGNEAKSSSRCRRKGQIQWEDRSRAPRKGAPVASPFVVDFISQRRAQFSRSNGARPLPGSNCGRFVER